MTDDIPPGLSKLIAEERASAGPSDSERARIRASIGASVGIATIAGTSATAGAASAGAAAGVAAGTAAATGIATKIIVLVVAVAAAGGGAAVMLRDRVPSSSVAPAPTPPPAAEQPSVPPAPAVAEVVHADPPAIVEPVKPTIAKPSVRTAAPAVPAETQGEILARAWALLSRGDADAVLVAVEKDAREHPSGQLREERDALRIEALLRLQRVTEARDRARAFATEFPDSVHRPTIDRALRDESGGGSAIEK